MFHFLAGRLPGYKWMLLLLTVAWVIASTAANYFGPRGGGRGWTLLMMFIWVSIGAVIVYSIIHRKQRPAAYGFSFAKGSLAALAIIVVIHAYLIVSGKFHKSTPDALLLSASGAFMEEIACRVIVIDSLILLMNG